MNVKILIISLISICGIITFALSVFSFQRRKITGALTFFGLMVTITLYSWGYAYELSGINLNEILLAVRIQYLALAALPVFWLILAVQYTGFSRWLTPAFYTAISIVPILTVVLINTNEYHHLFYTSTSTRQMGPFTQFIRTLGVGFWIQFAYLNICTLAGNILFFRMMLRSAPAYKRQAATIFTGSLFPWIVNFLSHSTTINPYEIDYNVYALAITSPFFAVAMFRSRILNLVPVAHDRVFDSMNESVFVVDNYGRIADINHAACSTVGITLSVIGRKIRDGLSHWPELIGILEKNEYGSFEVNADPSGEGKWFMANLSSLLDRNGQAIGKILIMSDISDKKVLEITIFENEKRLQADVMKVRDLQRIMMPDFSVVTGFDIGRVYRPVDELSGDFIDGFFIDVDLYQIVVCDVIDHGILPAFIGMEIRSMFRAMSEPGIMPSELISRVNIKLLEDFSELIIYATVAICQINIRNGQIIIAAAGHPPSFIYSAEEKKAEYVKTRGSLLGFRSSKPYENIVLDMGIHDIILLYTDGISEAMNIETNELYGTGQMKTDLVAHAGYPSKNIINSIMENVLNFTDVYKITDDMTMVCIKRI